MIDKTIVLDSCVDGDETYFGNLVGKDYDEFNLIYGVIKQNKDVIKPSDLKCHYSDHQDQIHVSIPLTKKIDVMELELPQNKAMDTKIDGKNLILNITVKKKKSGDAV